MAEDIGKSTIESSILGKLQRFNGKTSVRQFIKSIDKRGKLEKWDDEEKASVLKYLCTGFAETYIDSHPDLGDCDYDDLCENLINRFTPKLTTSDAYSKLLSIKQHRRSVEEYAEEIETVAANVADVIKDLADSDKRNEILVSVFTTGLDPHLKRLLTAVDIDDFADILKMAKRCEETFTEQRRNVNFLETPNYQPQQDYNPQQRAPQQDYNPQQRAGKRPPVQCWACGKYGHIKRDCRSQAQHYQHPRQNAGYMSHSSHQPNSFMNTPPYPKN